MFTEKEVTIIKALVEEEMSYSSTTPNKPEADILNDYKHTLSGIDRKIDSIISIGSKNYLSIS
jgi:hypothetical protein